MHLLSENEKVDIRCFVDAVVKAGLLPVSILDNVDANRLTKRDLSRIQRRIDGIIGGATIAQQPGAGQHVLTILMMAANAHLALSRIRVYDWK